MGYNDGTISQSYTTGSNHGFESIAGLVGYNNGTIHRSYSSANASGALFIGGLVGYNDSYGTINQSNARGYVSGSSGYIGGLVGGNGGTISQSYATGTTDGTFGVGGLAGQNKGSIYQSYATGDVSGSNPPPVGTGVVYTGGLVGINENGTIRHAYWNKNATQTENGTARSNNNKIAIGNSTGSVSVKYLRGFTLDTLESPTGLATDSIRELGPGFTYTKDSLPKINKGARITVNGVYFTQTVPTVTNIITNSTVANVIQGTDTTRATLNVGGVNFTANIIGTTNITSPYTITNIQNGVKGAQTVIFISIGNRTFGSAPFVLSATSSAGLPVLFSASNTRISIDNNTATIKAGGTVNITAYSIENDTVTFASQTQILTIQKRSQSISFGSLPDRTFGDAPFVLSATSSAGLGVFIFCI